eukprot:525839-Pelagomonas_calceolata.AAC.5
MLGQREKQACTQACPPRTAQPDPTTSHAYVAHHGAGEIEDRKRIQQLISRDPGSLPHQPAGLHSYSTDALLLKVESLQAQLNEQVWAAVSQSGGTAMAAKYAGARSSSQNRAIASTLAGAGAGCCFYFGTTARAVEGACAGCCF